ncbi:MAG TPA: M23 family metallopeptidase [Polyangiaceae bacterium]|nr:M23 family metallopeptidase [Polyangiaceae bacterium]
MPTAVPARAAATAPFARPFVRSAATLLALALGLRAVSLLAAPTPAPAPGAPDPRASEAARQPARGATAAAAPACPPRTLPDGGVCVPVPDSTRGGEALAEQRARHHDRSGHLRVYDQIPRRPERPADYRKFQLPVAPLAQQSFVTSGYDLDLPDDEQRRGAEMKAVGHGGIDLAQKRGTPVALVPLEHQVGDADVLFVGKLFGNSVVTHHAVREQGTLRDYLVIHGHLEKPASGLTRGASTPAGTVIGYVGDSGSPGVVHLHLEVRRAREGISLSALGPGELTQNSKTVACDPRNVLPLLGP